MIPSEFREFISIALDFIISTFQIRSSNIPKSLAVIHQFCSFINSIHNNNFFVIPELLLYIYNMEKLSDIYRVLSYHSWRRC